MSVTKSSSTETEEVSRNDLIQIILYRGQRLRNAMVQSILDHDPFNTEVFNDYQTESLVPTRLRKRIPSPCSSLNIVSSDVDKQKLKSYLKGESMSRQDQVEALEMMKSMSSEDVCKTTNEVYSSKCNCLTCQNYDDGDLNCDLKRFKRNIDSVDEDKLEEKFKFETCNEITPYLKYVDSLKISVHNLKLNDTGNKKVNSWSRFDKTGGYPGSSTFFVEYEIPFVLSVSTANKKIKKSSFSARNNNFVRICARQTSSEDVKFKHLSLHNIKNMDQMNLGRLKLKFRVTCRSMKQKTVIPLGYAFFNFENFQYSSTLTCIEELPVISGESVPVVLGNLCVTLQMGYGKLYFGNEFIAFFEENQKGSELSKTNNDRDQKFLSDEASDSIRRKVPSRIDRSKFSIEEKSKKHLTPRLKTLKNSSLRTTTILFGFLYIPEVQFTKPDINSFIACRPFCQEASCYSETVRSSPESVFNFTQVIPLIYEESLLQKFRDNFTVIEFWERNEPKNILIGLTKLSLNQFYFAYRNSDITKYLLDNKLPIISSDSWEVITHPYTDDIVGQAQVLLALGSEQQIRNLQEERGFHKNSVQAVTRPILEKNRGLTFDQKGKGLTKTPTHKKESHYSNTEKIGLRNSATPTKISNIVKETKDQTVQFDSEMDAEKLIKDKGMEQNEKLEQILNHLIAMRCQQDGSTNKTANKEDANAIKSRDITKPTDETISVPKQRISDSNDTNTQYQNVSPLVRSTSDLLSTLQAALSVPPPMRQHFSSCLPHTRKKEAASTQKKVLSSFKVHIAVNRAMHLPIRKKCKAKRNKGKSAKLDDNVKPSSYVTFETMPGLDLVMTPLVQKSTNPEWKYGSDVILPADLLTNNKKRLIFKVWRKSTHTNLQPNLQTDSIIGFAALDLTVLLSGLPNIKGWFNIIDISSKCNGQINIHVTPLEDLSVFKTVENKSRCCTSTNSESTNDENSRLVELPVPSQDFNDTTGHEDEGDGEVLSRALKRKFAELDEITQRLRLRLSHVTNDETEDENDEIAEQFEKDINTLSIEEDFDMVNFEEGGLRKSQTSDLLQIDCSSDSSSKYSDVNNALCISTEDMKVSEEVEESLSILDKQLLIGKHRIDTLLGKLSLISGEMNNSRYVSGCSGSNCEEAVNIDTEAILKDLNRHSRPNIHASTSYDKSVFQQIYEYSENGNVNDSTSSDTSVISHLEESRAAPDGEGNLSEERNVFKKM